MPKISVILPVYNCEDFILESVNSILIQTYNDFELIIIDDASTDSTVSVLEKIKDNRIRLIKKKANTGYTNSLNMGLQLANGKYIARMDGDDISLPDRFKKQVQCLDGNPDVAVCGTWYQLSGTDIVNRHPCESEDIKLALLETNSLGHPTVMFRKSVIEDLKLQYDPSMEPSEDYDLWVRIIRHNKIINIPEVLLYYRSHMSQVSIVREIQQKAIAQKVRIKLIGYLYNDYPSVNVTEKITFGKNAKKNKEQLMLFIKEIQKVKRLNADKKFFSALGFQHYLHNKKRQAIHEFFNHPLTSGLKYLSLFLFNSNVFYRSFKNGDKIKVAYKILFSAMPALIFVNCLLNHQLVK